MKNTFHFLALFLLCLCVTACTSAGSPNILSVTYSVQTGEMDDDNPVPPIKVFLQFSEPINKTLLVLDTMSGSIVSFNPKECEALSPEAHPNPEIIAHFSHYSPGNYQDIKITRHNGTLEVWKKHRTEDEEAPSEPWMKIASYSISEQAAITFKNFPANADYPDICDFL